MVSQKNLSHSSLMRDVAPPRLRWGEPRPPGPALLFDVDWTRRCLDLGVTASLLSDVMAARGGLVGGDGSPEEGTSGIPLCPCGKESQQDDGVELDGLLSQTEMNRRGRAGWELGLRTRNAGSAVVKSLEGRSGIVDEVAAGKDIRLTGSGHLAVTTITVIRFLFHCRHCCGSMPP